MILLCGKIEAVFEQKVCAFFKPSPLKSVPLFCDLNVDFRMKSTDENKDARDDWKEKGFEERGKPQPNRDPWRLKR